MTVVEGPVGAGRSSMVLEVLAAATTAGEWAAVVGAVRDAAAPSTATPGPGGPEVGMLGVSAAISAGVVLDRLAFVRPVSPDRWAGVVASLIDGCSVVVADTPLSIRPAETRRLLARLRERRTILLTDDGWPDRTARRVRVLSGHWTGLEAGDGRLVERELRVEVHARDRRVGQGSLARVS